jgi:hypothetical protein
MDCLDAACILNFTRSPKQICANLALWPGIAMPMQHYHQSVSRHFHLGRSLAAGVEFGAGFGKEQVSHVLESLSKSNKL